MSLLGNGFLPVISYIAILAITNDSYFLVDYKEFDQPHSSISLSYFIRMLSIVRFG